MWEEEMPALFAAWYVLSPSLAMYVRASRILLEMRGGFGVGFAGVCELMGRKMWRVCVL